MMMGSTARFIKVAAHIVPILVLGLPACSSGGDSGGGSSGGGGR